MKMRALFLFFCLCIISADTYAQRGMLRAYSRYMRASSKGKKLYQRDYMGYGLAWMNIEVKQHYKDLRYTDPNPNYTTVYTTPPIDTIIKTKYSGSSSVSYTEGTFFPLERIGKEGLIAIDFSATVSIIKYAIGKIDYSSATGIDEEGFTEQFNFPIALVYKSGGEVNLNKKSKFLFTIGCGISPNISGSKIIALSDMMFTTRKFMMVEMGVFAGIAWKIRGVVYSGPMTLINNPNADILDATSAHREGLGNLDINVIGRGGATLTLMIMPFSWDWRGSGDNYSYENRK